MDRRKFLKSAGVASAVVAGTTVGAGKLASAFASKPEGKTDSRPLPKKPNIVLVMVDDMGYMDVGFNGSKYYQTPRIDALAKGGMIFTSAYSNAPNCAPTRASLLSGQYSPRHGVFTVNSSTRGDARLRKVIPIKNSKTLASSVETFAERLKKVGYATASMGKWHLGDGATGPLGQGFDVNIGGNHAGHQKSSFSPYRNKDLKNGPRGEYLTDRLTNEAMKFIASQKRAGKPFMLYLPHFAVHIPLEAKRKHIEIFKKIPKEKRQGHVKYAAMIKSLDENVGILADFLKAQGLDKNTLLIFMSDNGGHGAFTSNKPLRGYKGTMYEGGIRVPMFAYWPGQISPGTSCDQPVITTDFYPTFLELAGATAAKNQPVDGESLVKLFRNHKATLNRDGIYWHMPVYLQSNGRYQSRQRDRFFRMRPLTAVRSGKWKLLEYYETPGDCELFDLENDIGETKDLSAKKPAVVKKLRAQIARWLKHTNAPLPTKPNPKYDAEFARKKMSRKK